MVITMTVSTKIFLVKISRAGSQSSGEHGPDDAEHGGGGQGVGRDSAVQCVMSMGVGDGIDVSVAEFPAGKFERELRTLRQNHFLFLRLLWSHPRFEAWQLWRTPTREHCRVERDVRYRAPTRRHHRRLEQHGLERNVRALGRTRVSLQLQ